MIEETPGLAFDTGFGVRQVVDDKLSVSLATRAFMSLAATEAALQTFLEAAPRASIDLLVLLLGWFYEQDRAVHFWHMDELLRHELLLASNDSSARWPTPSPRAEGQGPLPEPVSGRGAEIGSATSMVVPPLAATRRETCRRARARARACRRRPGAPPAAAAASVAGSRSPRAVVVDRQGEPGGFARDAPR